jgi:hypothetical protein
MYRDIIFSTSHNIGKLILLSDTWLASGNSCNAWRLVTQLLPAGGEWQLRGNIQLDALYYIDEFGPQRVNIDVTRWLIHVIFSLWFNLCDLCAGRINFVWNVSWDCNLAVAICDGNSSRYVCGPEKSERCISAKSSHIYVAVYFFFSDFIE